MGNVILSAIERKENSVQIMALLQNSSLEILAATIILNARAMSVFQENVSARG